MQNFLGAKTQASVFLEPLTGMNWTFSKFSFAILSNLECVLTF